MAEDTPAKNKKDAASKSPARPNPNLGVFIGAGIGAGIGSAAVAAALLYSTRHRSKKNPAKD